MFILSFVVCGFMGYAHAGPLANLLEEELAKSLWDTNLIDESVLSISNMPIDAVENLSRVLGSCIPIKGGQLRDYFCERDKTIFQVKFKVPHPVNSIINALIAASDVMIDQSKFTSDEQKKYILGLYQQQELVINKISDAISRRLASK